MAEMVLPPPLGSLGLGVQVAQLHCRLPSSLQVFTSPQSVLEQPERPSTKQPEQGKGGQRDQTPAPSCQQCGTVRWQPVGLGWAETAAHQCPVLGMLGSLEMGPMEPPTSQGARRLPWKEVMAPRLSPKE